MILTRPIQYPCHCCNEQSEMWLGVVHKLCLQEEGVGSPKMPTSCQRLQGNIEKI